MRYLYGCDELRDAIRLDYDSSNFSSDAIFHVLSRYAFVPFRSSLCLKSCFQAATSRRSSDSILAARRMDFYRWSKIRDRSNRVIIMLSPLQYKKRSCLHHITTSRNE